MRVLYTIYRKESDGTLVPLEHFKNFVPAQDAAIALLKKGVDEVHLDRQDNGVSNFSDVYRKRDLRYYRSL